MKAAVPPVTARPGGNYFARRWRGTVPWPRLFWHDMLMLGSMVNLLASFGALMLAALDASAAAVALHFAPVPYNAFLLAALWRLPGRPALAAAAGALWFVVMAVV